MLPYGRQSVDDSDIDAVAAVLAGDWLTTGPAVAEFEQAVAQAAGVTDSVSVTSGTAALHVAYAAVGLRPGDEVITPPMTFVATQATAALLGASIVFADVDPETGLIDPAAVAAVLSERTRVVAAVDYAGQTADLDALLALTRPRGITLLEDAAHSIGTTDQGRLVGSIADVTTFSFYPTKNITTGEGGAVVSTDADLLSRARTFHAQGLIRDRTIQRYPDEGPWHQEVHDFGLNYRLPDVLAALGTAQIRRLAHFKAERARLSARYDELLADVPGVLTPVRRRGVDATWHLYPLRVLDGRRREVFEHLRARGIGVQVNYIPAYWHPVFEDLGYQRGLCPGAETFYSQQISLPLFVGLTDADQDRVVGAIVEIMGH